MVATARHHGEHLLALRRRRQIAPRKSGIALLRQRSSRAESPREGGFALPRLRRDPRTHHFALHHALQLGALFRRLRQDVECARQGNDPRSAQRRRRTQGGRIARWFGFGQLARGRRTLLQHLSLHQHRHGRRPVGQCGLLFAEEGFVQRLQRRSDDRAGEKARDGREIVSRAPVGALRTQRTLERGYQLQTPLFAG